MLAFTCPISSATLLQRWLRKQSYVCPHADQLVVQLDEGDLFLNDVNGHEATEVPVLCSGAI